MAITPDAARDLDETRRLLYMALLANGNKRYNLIGTLANALIHHQHAAEHPDEVIANIVGAVETADEDCLDWVQSHIDSITSELEGRDE